MDINIKNLDYSINNTIIFNNFNLKIKEGSFISIAGNNTSGKTTLIKLLAGLLPNNDSIVYGYSYLDSKRVYDHSKDIGVVIGTNLNSFLFDDVYKEMAFPLENLNYPTDKIESRILEIASFLDINKLLDKKTYDLTNSEKQLLLIAIALLSNPKLLLLATPFSMMAKKTKIKARKKINEYHKKNKTTIILTTIDLEDTLKADYLYILNKGKIAIEGKPLTVLKEDILLNRLGLSLPFMVDLSLKLEFYSLLDDIELDMDRMVDKLWK